MTLFMCGQWLYQDIVYVLTGIISDIVYVWTVVNSRHGLCMDSGYISTLFKYGQWLYLDMFNVWTVVISRHCL